MLFWDRSQVPVSHYGRCFLSFVFTSSVCIPGLSPVDRVLCTLPCQDLFFLLPLICWTFFRPFSFLCLLLGSSFAFASLLGLLTSVSMETGTRQRSDIFWVVPFWGWEHPEGEGEGQFLYEEMATRSSFSIPHPLMPVAQDVASCWPLGYCWVLERSDRALVQTVPKAFWASILCPRLFEHYRWQFWFTIVEWDLGRVIFKSDPGSLRSQSTERHLETHKTFTLVVGSMRSKQGQNTLKRLILQNSYYTQDPR